MQFSTVCGILFHSETYRFIIGRGIFLNFVFLIFIPIIAALFVPLLYKTIKRIHTGWFVLIVPIVLFAIYTTLLPQTMKGESIVSTLQWIPSMHMNFVSYIDGLSLLFSLLITGIGSLVVLYSIFYLSDKKEQLGHFYVYLLLFMSAMLGVVQSDNVISLYLFWELTSISSFLLIAYWYTNDRSRFGALKSMMITVFGGLMMLGGFAILGIAADTFSIREMIANASTVTSHPLFTMAAVLILLGAFTKSAQFPFYIWLPDAMEAPTPVSAYLHSATMVKAGLYLVARFTPLFASSSTWIWLVMGVGIFTLFWGSFFAVKQTDLKAILAFSTVSQLGLIMSLLGASALTYHSNEAMFAVASFAAIFHLLNHATFKGSLFMVAGIVDLQTGTRDIRKLGGLMSIMPLTFTVAAIGSFSMAGLPPFNGFLSKEMFLDAMLAVRSFELFQFETWGILFPIIAWIASVFTFIYSMYFVFHTFGKKGDVEALPKAPKEAPTGMLISPIILATLVVVIFFIPNVFGKWLIKPAVLALQPNLYDTPQQIDITIAAWHGFDSMALWMTIGVVAVGTLLYLSMNSWKKIYDAQPERLTLNNGYDALLNFTESGMNKISRSYMTGIIRSYFMYMFAAIAIMTLIAVYVKDAFAFDPNSFAPVTIYAILNGIILVLAISFVLLAKSRMAAFIALGASGYSVALFFVMFKAPDLALTQLVIETVSVALFLLAFQRLPELKNHGETKKNKVANAIIAIGVGFTVMLVALASQSQKLLPSISEYYKETVETLAAGGNIVNVILVDYRGFDTLFEIAVLSIAAIGVYTMIKLRLKGEKKADENE